ncbi:hypothetical protein N7495_007684 [Penicillium taxi]|uniref:uncharacterized protein n=1 Tax=Penicillium taxi TaxID=168475 RepID=UPI002544D3EE|nr:uncharacterized protein N7495_007684 [Penicillium taxi]KAJ5887643.1 hypothetical protein N7495_007684 [Penicillium taxi]
MAPGLTSPVPGNLSSSFYNGLPGGGSSRQVSSFSNHTHFDNDNISNTGHSTRREFSMTKKINGAGNSNITSVVQSLYRRSGDELGASTSSKLMNTTYYSLIEWIRVQRMSHLPPEGSSFDKVLTWAQLFVERLHHFDRAIAEFAGDSYLATQLSYGYCGMLLELGKENAAALMISFGFFYSTSSTLVNLLERTELFAVSQDIKEQLILALADLVTLVSSVGTHYHQAICGLTTASVTVNIYNTFPGQIQSFRERCGKIADAMWRHQLSNANADPERLSVVRSVRTWLAPEDHVLADLAENTSHLSHEREEMTCLWMSPYLSHLLKNDKRTLSFTGPPGSGKTVLASVIVDRLQDAIGGVRYKSIFVPINARIPAETTYIAIIKTILFQLFEKRIGNVPLLNILGDAYERSKRTVSEAEYEAILWTTFERALSSALRGAKELVIIVDGIDEATGGETNLLQKLITATTNATGVKLITFGSQKPTQTKDLIHVPISEERIADDVSIVVRSNLESSKVFQQMSEMEQEIAIDQITEASRGSFLWAKLCTKRVRHEHSPESFLKTVETIISSKAMVNDFVLYTVLSSGVSDDARLILLWLATAERPFLLKELAILASIDAQKQIITDRKVNPLEILRPVNSLVFFQDGHVYLRHGLIRTALLDVFSKGKLIPTIKDRHADFITRLFIYLKNISTEPHEPSMSPLGRHDTTILLQSYPLLDFAIRYWPRHLKQTSVFLNGGDVPAAKEFSKIFPCTITFLLLQTTVWQNIPTPTLLSYQTTVTNVLRQILSSSDVVTLQSILMLAILQRETCQTTRAIPLFYEIMNLSRTLLTTRHLITMQISTLFLELTDEQVTTSKTDIMVKREETLLLLIECYKVHYGKNSEQVVSTYKTLIEHYSRTKEEEKIEEITIIIQGITASEYNGYDKDKHGDLHVHLRGGRHGDGDIGTRFVLDIEEDECLDKSESFDFEMLVKLAQQYYAERRVIEAERVYVEIWQRASRECRIQHSAYWEEIKLKSVVAYSSFLKSEKREYEACSILSSVWEEYRHNSLSLTEASCSHFQEIATVMESVGLSVAALSIFKQCAHYYQSTNRTQSSKYTEIQKSITKTSEHVMKQASSSHSVVSESTLEEIVFEASSSITKIDQSSFTATATLIELYISQHRWKDATRVVKTVLQGLWPSLFAPSIEDVVLPSKHVEKCVELAQRLSQSYHYRRRFPREENIRIRVYRAVHIDRPVDDKLRVCVTEELIRFFEYSSQTEKVITTRQEILDDYINHYGTEHPIVIKTLWTLAEITRPQPIFVEYYQRIIRALNKDSSVCKPEALEPLIIVATELWTQTRYSDAGPYLKLLFTTFLSHPKQPRFESTTFVQEIFSHYIHCLRFVRTDYTMIHKIAVDYQSKVKVVFGATASITIQATLTLAKICQESKRYELEAIALYEELLKIKCAPGEIDFEEISATLDGIYEEQTLLVTSKSESVSSTQIERATRVLRKRITSVRESHGWAHEESLSKMKEIVSFHSKHNESESVLKELKDSTVQILSKETSSTRLVSAAIAIASSYVATKQITKATELTQELYRQIVMKDTTNVEISQFNLSSKGRQSLVFLAQLEYSLSKQTSTITEILASLTTEYVYFEEFRNQISSKTSSFHSVSISTSRLWHFLVKSNRKEASARVFNDYFAYFITNDGKRTKLTEKPQVTIFLLTILDHFSTHQSTNFIRSVGIASNVRVIELIRAKQYESASDLALASFRYICAHDEFHTTAIVKFTFTLGIFISGRTITPQPEKAVQKKLHSVSTKIMTEVLSVIKELNINLATIGLEHLNALIGILGEQKDYKNLAWLLNGLWDNRNKQHWDPVVNLGLARRYILARYLVGDALKASRLAEDIVYNCRRVNGARHPSTLEMSTLLSQLYTAIAQRYQAEKSGQNMANKYYKKSAIIHENLLRIFVDPKLTEFEGVLESSTSIDGSTFGDFDVEANDNSLSDGEHVRQHLLLLKLAVQRLGEWPKEYAEYEGLSADLFLEFQNDLKDVEGVEKWNLKSFGSGKASGSEDILDLEFGSWELDLTQPDEIEEEL